MRRAASGRRLRGGARLALPCVLLLALACRNEAKEHAGAASPTASGAAAVAESESAADTAPPLSAGQWTRYRVTRADGTTSEIAYEVVGQEGEAYWVEVASGGATGTVIQLLITLPDRARPENSDILGVKMRLPDGQVRELRGDDLGGTKQAYAKNIREIFPPPSPSLKRVDLNVPAGRFVGCSERETTTEIDGEKKTRSVWTHASVPITSMVKSKSADGDELVLSGHGLTGAKSDL